MICPKCQSRMRYAEPFDSSKHGSYWCEFCYEMYSEKALEEEEKRKKERLIDWKEK